MVKLRSAFAFVAVALALIEVCTAGFARDVSLHVPLGAVLSISSQPEALLGRGLPSRILTAKAVEEEAVEAVEKTIFIKATPEECFRVASGYEDYPKWAKATAGVSVLSRENGLGKQVEMRMGMFGIEVKSIFEYNYNRPTQMEWTSVGGTIKELYGRYTFVQEGEGTQVTYKLSVQPPFPLPGYIKKATNRAICATALGELRSYTENPKTLAKVRESIERELGPRKSGGGSTATASLAHARQQKVWEDVLEICFTSHSSTWSCAASALRRGPIGTMAEGYVTLNDGNLMPTFGLGVYQTAPGQATYSAVLCALKSGYRHIDTAALYQNEEDVGRAIQDSGVPREQIFVTTKLWTLQGDADYEGTLAALAVSLAKLKLAYVDLYLIHSPNDAAKRLEQWRALEAARKDGRAKSIGVSNYGIHHLKELEEVATIPPATNQIELHPWLTRNELVSYCQSKGIVLTAYSPLAKARKMNDPKLMALAAKYQRTPAQVLIRWSLERGFVTIPKSTKEERIIENMKFSFEMDPADVTTMSSWNSDMTTGWDPTVKP